MYRLRKPHPREVPFDGKSANEKAASIGAAFSGLVVRRRNGATLQVVHHAPFMANEKFILSILWPDQHVPANEIYARRPILPSGNA